MSEKYRPVVVIFDLDGTITLRDTYVEFLIGFLRRNPARVIRSMLLPFALTLYTFGWRDNSWLKETFLNAIAGGASRKEIMQYIDVFVSKLIKEGLRPGAIQAIQHHRREGHVLVLATASLDFYADKIGSDLGFSQVISTQSIWDSHDKLTGKICGGNCYNINKLKKIKDVLGAELCEYQKIVYTDHHADLPIIEWADKAIVVNPTGCLRRLAFERNYEIQDWS